MYLMTDAFVHIEKKDGLAIISLNNPSKNYIPQPAFIEKKIILDLAADPEIKGIIIQGAGRNFSAGADVQNLMQQAIDETILLQDMNAGMEILEIISTLNIPVIAAIQGACWGGGLEIALAAHVRMADKKAWFAFPESAVGLMPGWGGISHCAARMNVYNSLKLLLGNEIIDVQQALELKLIDEIIENDVLKTAFDYLQNLVADKPKSVIECITKAINNSYILPINKAVSEETRMFCELAAAESKLRKTESL
jgi:enoyl-CoA hydratase